MRRLTICPVCAGVGELIKFGRLPDGNMVFEAKWCRKCGGVGYYPVSVQVIKIPSNRRQRRLNKKGKRQ